MSFLSRIRAVVAIASLAPAGSTLAQQPDSTSLPRVIITASRVETPLAGSVLASTVLSGDTLRRAGIRDVAEALRMVPGVAIARTGGPGAQTSLFVRGGESDYVRVLVDGVAVNDAGGAIDLSWLSLHDVDRIEVVRGPSSVLYGTDAVTGVVQIFTRHGRGAPRFEAAAEAGRYGTVRGELSVIGGGATAGVAVTGARERSDGLLPFNNDYAGEVFSLRSYLRVGDSRVQFAARHGDETYHYPTDGAGNVVDHNAWRADRRTTLAADAAHQFNPRWRGELTLTSHTGQGRTLDLPDDASDTAGFHSYRSRGKLRRQSAGARLHFAPTTASVMTVGAEWSTDQQESRDSSNYDASTNAFDAERLNRGYFGQWLMERGRLVVSAGARYDDNDSFGDFRTARVAAAWRLWNGGVIRASTGNAFKAPTFLESFSSAFSIGNAALRPERSRSWEVGVRHDRPDGRWRLGATWFDQRFADLIQYTFAAPGQPNFFNVARATARGLEVDGESSVVGLLRVVGSATFLRSRVEDAGFDTDAGAAFVAGQRLLRRPSHSATLGVSADRGGTLLDLTAHFTGARDDRDFSSYPATPVRLPAHARVDLSAERELTTVAEGSAVHVLARLENLFGAGYQEVAHFPAPGRALVVGVRLAPRR